MNKVNLLILLFTNAIFFSCGPSEESIRKEAEERTKLNMETKISLQDSIRKIEVLITKATKELSNVKAQLEVEKDKLVRVKEWQFGRTESEREDQIRNQTKIINDITDYVSEMSINIPKAQEKVKQLQGELELVEMQLNE